MADEETEFVHGLNLILTNRLPAAELFFNQQISARSSSTSNNNASQAANHQLEHCKRVHATFGLALVALIKALISFEEDEKHVALTRLHQTQKLAAASSSSSSSFFTAPSSFWSNLASSSSTATAAADAALTSKYAEIVNLISADAGVFIALLQFTNESAMGFVKGTFALRKSYKVYQKACPSTSSTAAAGGAAVNIHLPRTVSATSTRVDFIDGDVYFDASPLLLDDAQHDTGYGPLVSSHTSMQDRIDSFGLLGSGIFTLAFSMIPPRFQSVIGKAMGFDTQAHKREDGLGLLVAAMNQRTSRAPIAALVLLGFHSAMLIMARGAGEQAEQGHSEQVAARVLEECLVHYPDSPVFRFLEGRLHRGRAQVEQAKLAFEVSAHCSRGMDALLHLSLYERGWCEGLLGNFHVAGEVFSRVARESQWSPSFYSYLAACFYYEYAYRVLVWGQVGRGSVNSAKRALRQALLLFKLVPSGVRMSKRGQLIPPEALACDRANQVGQALQLVFPPLGQVPEQLEPVPAELLVTLCMRCPFLPSMECLYIWNSLFQTPDKLAMLEDLQRVSPSEPAAVLYRGYLLRELGRFRDALDELGQIEATAGSGGGASSSTGSWVGEFAKYERGLCLFELGDKPGAVHLWQSVRDCDHAMDSRLKFRLRAALNKA